MNHRHSGTPAPIPASGTTAEIDGPDGFHHRSRRARRTLEAIRVETGLRPGRYTIRVRSGVYSVGREFQVRTGASPQTIPLVLK